MKLEYGNVSNPYEDDKNKNKKNKKKSKDVFQNLIEQIFEITEKELWKQRCLDRHQPKNKSRYTEIIKTDREISKLYGLADEVKPADKETFFPLDLENRLSQPLHEKKRWIIR